MSDNVPSYTIDLTEPPPYAEEGYLIADEHGGLDGVYRCRTCQALVTWAGQDGHTTWHDSLLAGIGEAMAVLIRASR